MGRGERKPLAYPVGLIEMLRMFELLKEHPISNWLIRVSVPRVRDWACHWPEKSLRCDDAGRALWVKMLILGGSVDPFTTGVAEWGGQPLTDFPRPCAIFFVVARSLVQDGRSVLIPDWWIFFVKIHGPFLGREGAEGRTFRETKSNDLLETLVY
jgi:hypothetical protein